MGLEEGQFCLFHVDDLTILEFAIVYHLPSWGDLKIFLGSAGSIDSLGGANDRHEAGRLGILSIALELSSSNYILLLFLCYPGPVVNRRGG